MLATPKLLNHVQAHLHAGKPEAARTLLVRHLRQSPGDPALNSAMCVVLAELGQIEGALYYAEKGLRASPRDAGMYINLGNVHAMAKRTDEAVAAFRRAVEIEPGNALAWATMGRVLITQDRFVEAERVLLSGLEQCPGNRDILMQLSAVMFNNGRVELVMPMMRDLVERHPSDLQVASRLAYLGVYAHNLAPETVRMDFDRYGRLMQAGAEEQRYRTWSNSREPERRLVVAMVTGEFRGVAGARFLEPLLRHSDPARLELRCYFTAEKGDATTDLLRALAPSWTDVYAMTPGELASRLRRDAVDIAVDETGLTHAHRHPVFALKPTPVQVTWLGLPSTTGLPTMDYRLVDRRSDPPEMAALSSERLLYAEGCFTAYAPPDAEFAAERFPVMDPPCVRDDSPTRGTVTFGSFSTIQKLNSPTLRRWSRLLNAVPGSKLLMRHSALCDPMMISDLRARFESAGAPAGSVVLEPPSHGPRQLLPQYNRVDIALDTWPYTGTTTTCEALFMGVPVVTLLGRTSASRIAMSILGSAGLDELVTADDEQFVSVARALATDPDRLCRYRRELRARFLASPAGDVRAFARRFEAALRTAWREWCASGEA